MTFNNVKYINIYNFTSIFYCYDGSYCNIIINICYFKNIERIQFHNNTFIYNSERYNIEGNCFLIKHFIIMRLIEVIFIQLTPSDTIMKPSNSTTKYIF